MMRWFRRQPPPPSESVPCRECGVMVLREYATKVVASGSYYRNYEQFFCLAHKKPYHAVVNGESGSRYYREFEVNDLGVPIGFVPEKAKKK